MTNGRVKPFLLRVFVLLLISLSIGTGVSLLQRQTYLPALDGDVSALSVVDGAVFCAVSRDQDSLLLRMDTDGTLLNYCRAGADELFQSIAVHGQAVYAIMSTHQGGETAQKLVVLSLDDPSMQPQTLCDLTQLPGTSGEEIVWQGMLIPDETCILLTGTTAQGSGYCLTWWFDQGTGQVDTVAPGEQMVFFSPIAQAQFLYVTQDRQLNSLQNGITYRNILQGTLETPLQITACAGRSFISDSVTGDLYEICPDGTARLFRAGSDAVGISGHTYHEYSIYTVYASDTGALRAAGVCDSAAGAQVVGEEWDIQVITSRSHQIRLFWQHCWPAALAAFLLIALMGICLNRITRSPRLSTRLTLCELVAALLLLAGVTGIQYRSYQDTIWEAAWQKLHLLGGSLASNLEADAPMSPEEVSEAVSRLERSVSAALSEAGETYTLRILWSTPNGPAIGYDAMLPAGYLVEDVETHNYLTAVERALETGGSNIQILRGEVSTNYLYLQAFRQGTQTGCVTVSQPREVLLQGQLQFFQRMLPILAACPLLFLALLWITRRLLSPLHTIRQALEAFYACGGGNQMELSTFPHTELYEVGRVFNQLSVETKIQFNELQAINDAYMRLVPNCLTKILGKTKVCALQAGQTATLEAALLVIAPLSTAQDLLHSTETMNQTAEAIGSLGGIVVDHDEGLGSLTALFPTATQALDCARVCADAPLPVMTAVLEERVTVGLVGGKHLLVPLVLSPAMARRLAVLALLRRFGARAVRCGKPHPGLRLLGWDAGIPFYEETIWRPSQWQSAWQDASPLWAQAMEQYCQRQFPAAMRKFAALLSLLPGDGATRWYLFRCEALRSTAPQTANTDLLFEWEGSA